MYIMTKNGWQPLYEAKHTYPEGSKAANIVVVSKTLGLATRDGNRLDPKVSGEVVSEYVVLPIPEIKRRALQLEKLHRNTATVRYL